MALRESTKMATCCYCGARTLLQLDARDGHELACGRCGAPLHEMKAMPIARDKPAKPGKKVKSAGKPSKPKKKAKKRKGFAYWLGEALDELDDLFD